MMTRSVFGKWVLIKGENKLKATGRNLAIQGEIVGSGIQGNQYKLNSHQLFVFSIYDIDKGTYLPPSERLELIKEMVSFFLISRIFIYSINHNMRS
jgi:ATP-dependent RNA circularization protein (DNA/RNA ligase family)